MSGKRVEVIEVEEITNACDDDATTRRYYRDVVTRNLQLINLENEQITASETPAATTKYTRFGCPSSTLRRCVDELHEGRGRGGNFEAANPKRLV